MSDRPLYWAAVAAYALLSAHIVMTLLRLRICHHWRSKSLRSEARRRATITLICLGLGLLIIATIQ